jgi:hypothetical protein
VWSHWGHRAGKGRCTVQQTGVKEGVRHTTAAAAAHVAEALSPTIHAGIHTPYQQLHPLQDSPPRWMVRFCECTTSTNQTKHCTIPNGASRYTTLAQHGSCSSCTTDALQTSCPPPSPCIACCCCCRCCCCCSHQL